MAILNRLTGLVNVGLRGSSLAFRFILSFYIIKYLGLEAAGIYGLALGAIGIAPAITTLGINYFHARELVGMPPHLAAPRMKTRLLASTVVTALLAVGSLATAIAVSYPITPILILVAALVWLEIYANDMHVSLVALEMPFQANIVLFVRLAAWVPFVIGIGLLVPETRTIEFVLGGWLASYVLYFALLWWFLRHWPLREAVRAPIQVPWLKERLKRSWLIYFSDIGLVGYIYVDRYIVSFMLGLELTGLYNFYWSLANALQTLLATAIIQLAMPTLYKAYNTGVITNWRTAMRRQIIKTATYAGALGLCVYVAAEILIAFMDMGHVTEHRGVFIMLLVAAMIRSGSDLANVGLMSVRMDRTYAFTNLASLLISAAVTFLFTALMGFPGVGIASLVTATIVTATKAGFLLRFAYGSHPAPAGSGGTGDPA
ncbi:lipopolysaccharide biosynthesis protein [Xanthobacter sp. V3C-3]|uniref:lipopolysaccharide biosynthesis protein n=1 Tax=Xanthobacter lutulentifluminis TaxID=3119935 RepID=UPI00372BB38D